MPDLQIAGVKDLGTQMMSAAHIYAAKWANGAPAEDPVSLLLGGVAGMGKAATETGWGHVGLTGGDTVVNRNRELTDLQANEFLGATGGLYTNQTYDVNFALKSFVAGTFQFVAGGTVTELPAVTGTDGTDSRPAYQMQETAVGIQAAFPEKFSIAVVGFRYDGTLTMHVLRHAVYNGGNAVSHERATQSQLTTVFKGYEVDEVTPATAFYAAKP